MIYAWSSTTYSFFGFFSKVNITQPYRIGHLTMPSIPYSRGKEIPFGLKIIGIVLFKFGNNLFLINGLSLIEVLALHSRLNDSRVIRFLFPRV